MPFVSAVKLLNNQELKPGRGMQCVSKSIDFKKNMETKKKPILKVDNLSVEFLVEKKWDSCCQ